MDEYKLRMEMEASRQLLAEFADEIGTNPDDILNAVEGQTGLIEIIAKAVDAIDETEIMVMGLAKKIAEFGERKTILKNRVNRIRALVEQAMVICEQQKITLPTATLSLRKIAPGLVILDESEIPLKYWIEQERPAPKLDKKAVLVTLKGDELHPGMEVAGAELDNGSISLTVRRK